MSEVFVVNDQSVLQVPVTYQCYDLGTIIDDFAKPYQM